MVKKAYDRAKSVLTEHRAKLDQLSQELMSRETLSYEDVEQLIGPPAHGSKKTVGVERSLVLCCVQKNLF